MKFGKTFVGQPVFFEGYDEEENEITLFGYIKGVHMINESGHMMIRVNVSTDRDAIVNLRDLNGAKGVY